MPPRQRRGANPGRDTNTSASTRVTFKIFNNRFFRISVSKKFVNAKVLTGLIAAAAFAFKFIPGTDIFVEEVLRESFRRFLGWNLSPGILTKRPKGKTSDSANSEKTDNSESNSYNSSESALLPDAYVTKLQVVNTYPHDEAAYTQGLFFKDGYFYESTGHYGQSELRKVEVESGKVVKRVKLPDHEFGEGIAFYQNSFWQMVWQKSVVYRYDNEFNLLGTYTTKFKFEDGWGFTTSADGSKMYATDSGKQLFEVKFEKKSENSDDNDDDDDLNDHNKDGNLITISQVTVTGKHNKHIEMPNEIELIKEDPKKSSKPPEIWANIYAKDCIARIEPHSGKVVGWVLADHLRRDFDLGKNPEVFNGIAIDDEKKRLFVTGKNWNKMFEVKLVPLEGNKEMKWAEIKKLCVAEKNLFRPR